MSIVHFASIGEMSSERTSRNGVRYVEEPLLWTMTLFGALSVSSVDQKRRLECLAYNLKNIVPDFELRLIAYQGKFSGSHVKIETLFKLYRDSN